MANAAKGSNSEAGEQRRRGGERKMLKVTLNQTELETALRFRKHDANLML